MWHPTTFRAALAAREALLAECREEIADMEHAPRCYYVGGCLCGKEDLLRRIEAVLKGDGGVEGD